MHNQRTLGKQLPLGTLHASMINKRKLHMWTHAHVHKTWGDAWCMIANNDERFELKKNELDTKW